MLKTNCENCIFSTPRENGQCVLSKETFIENKVQYTKGFCRHKRNVEWLVQQHDKKIKSLIELIQKEEKIAVIINLVDNNLEKVQKTIKCVLDVGPNELIIVSQNDGIFDKLAQYLKTTVKLRWSLCLLNEKNVENIYMMDFGVDNIKSSHWFLFINSGDRVEIKEINLIKSILNGNNNIACLFKDETDNERIFTNRSAFIQLNGNAGLPFFQKIQSFDDWRLSCIKVTSKYQL